MHTTTKSHLDSKGITYQFTAPYLSQQTGVAERNSLAIITHAHTMLLASAVPKFLWPGAVAYGTCIKNRAPTRPLGNITPLEARNPTSHLREGENTSKLDSRVQRAIFVGFSE